MTTDSQTPSDAAWRKCRPGELLELGVQQKQLRQRRAILRGIGIATAGAAAVALGIVWFPRSKASLPPGDLACDAVRPLLPAYLAHQLDAQLTSQIERHLDHCEHCSQTLQQLKSATGMTQSTSPRRGVQTQTKFDGETPT